MFRFRGIKRQKEFGTLLAKSFIECTNKPELVRYKRILKHKTEFTAQKAFYDELMRYKDDFFGAAALWIEKDYTPLSKRFRTLVLKKEKQWVKLATSAPSPPSPWTKPTTSSSTSTGSPTLSSSSGQSSTTTFSNTDLMSSMTSQPSPPSPWTTPITSGAASTGSPTLSSSTGQSSPATFSNTDLMSS